MVSTENLDMRKLFPRKRVQTTVERHKANINKEKSEKSEKKSRLKKLAMIRKCGDILSQFGLQFDPVVIGNEPSHREKKVSSAAIKKSSRTPTKQVKVRPLLKKKPEAVVSEAESAKKTKKKFSGLKIRTITPSTKTTSGKRKSHSH